jgi:hypothetical protein
LADAVRETKKPKPLINVRKQLWEFYLSTGRGANALFEAIDIDENGSVEPRALKEFMIDVLVDADGDPIDPQELMPYAWNRLEQREAAGQSYDMKVRQILFVLDASLNLLASPIFVYRQGLQTMARCRDKNECRYEKLSHARIFGAKSKHWRSVVLGCRGRGLFHLERRDDEPIASPNAVCGAWRSCDEG